MDAKEQYPIEEQLWFAGMLTMIAGSLDAYSFLFHGGVFAGLQTGNLILLGIHLGQNSLSAVVRHSLSILAFAIGTIIIRIVQLKVLKKPQENASPAQLYLESKRKHQLHLIVLIYEMMMILLSVLLNFLGISEVAAMLLSMAAAAELQEFRKVRGQTFTPLTMTGDLRSLAESIFDESVSHAATAKKKAVQTFVLMFCFIIGSALVGYSKAVLSTVAIVIPLTLLMILTIFMIINNVKFLKQIKN